MCSSAAETAAAASRRRLVTAVAHCALSLGRWSCLPHLASFLLTAGSLAALYGRGKGELSEHHPERTASQARAALGRGDRPGSLPGRYNVPGLLRGRRRGRLHIL